MFQPPTQCFVDATRSVAVRVLALGQLGLDQELRALGIEHGEKVRDAAFVTAGGPAPWPGSRTLGGSQVIPPDLLVPEIHQCVLRFLERVRTVFS